MADRSVHPGRRVVEWEAVVGGDEGFNLLPTLHQVGTAFGPVVLFFRWKRKRGTNQWYVYTFIADKPFRSVKAKIRALTHRVSQSDMATVIGRINQFLRGWTAYFRHAVCKHTLNRLRHFVN